MDSSPGPGCGPLVSIIRTDAQSGGMFGFYTILVVTQDYVGYVDYAAVLVVFRSRKEGWGKKRPSHWLEGDGVSTHNIPHIFFTS